MIIKLFGVLDLFAALVLFLLGFGIWKTLGIIFGVYLILKGLVFLSFVSMVDILTGVLMILAGSGNYINFSWVFIFWLVQKGFVSLYS